MTDILANIDDTLADWHGSADSMRWRPEDGAKPETPAPAQRPQPSDVIVTLTADTGPVTQQFQAIADYLSRLLPDGLRFTWGTDNLETRPRRSFLDARYHQRQRNRRKRK